MYKCIFCKKHPIKGLYRCEITGKVLKKECEGFTPAQTKHFIYKKNKCPNFTASVSDRFFEWLDIHT